MKLKIALGILAISIVLAMVASGIVIGAGSVNNASNVSLSSAIIYVPDDYAKIQWAVDNATDGDTIIVRDGTYMENVDVNKSLIIKSENGTEATSVQAADSNDHVFEVTADYVNISGFTVEGAGYYLKGWKSGIYLNNADHCNISNNNISTNTYGIHLYFSSNNIIVFNDILSNSASDMGYGIYLYSSSTNTITNNSILWNDKGIIVEYSSDNKIINNNFNNSWFGIGLFHSLSIKIKQCTSRGGIFVIDSYNNTVEDCFVSGEPLVYLENVKDKIIIQDVGQVILVSCENITVSNSNISTPSFIGVRMELLNSTNCNIENNELNLSIHGIILDNSSNNIILNNCLKSYVGIYMYYSSENIVTNNNCSITFCNSSNNKIYLNNLVNLVIYPSYYNLTNIWNSTEKITYTYNGSTYTNYLGNYWDDYKEKYPDAKEIGGSGIWDTPYSIDSDQDNHPLKELWEIYFAPTENIFDTGSPANPYPSIMGNHTGTIKPNHTVIATKLYTYPCVGTGGHTEYARIWNSTWNATATWEGYAGDWHNITFDKTVVLLAGETYNYTIRTGSYPQIIHESAFNATGGTITCDKFVDANGRIYYDRIQAIKLWT
jgi:parallel beta-helix repeat protein